MTEAERIAWTGKVLAYLNASQQRCTYSALGGLLGVPPQSVRRYLGDKRKAASWVVRATNGEPSGYENEELHDHLYQSPTIIRCPDALRRRVSTDPLALHPALKPNTRIRMDGLEFLSLIPSGTIPAAFFDPQHRGVLDRLSYGNEGKTRGRRRSELPQMSDGTIAEFVRGIDRVLSPSGHLFLWTDKFHLCQGVHPWLQGASLTIVDLVTWDKECIGMGYRTRRKSEHCVILQKKPRRAKGVWTSRRIPDVYPERVSQNAHPHAKPIGLQGELLAAVTHEGDFVIDPAAGSFSVMEAARRQRRAFLGCDLNG